MPITDVTVKLVSGAIKDQAVISEAVEGAAPKGICIGFSGVDNRRQVEIVQGIKQVSRAIIDTHVIAELTEQMGSIPIGGGRSDIFIASPVTPPILGSLFVIIDENYPFFIDSTGFHSDVTTALAALSDNYLKSV
jgi:hypothetical protein